MKKNPGRKEQRRMEHQTGKKRGDINRASYHKGKSQAGMKEKK